LKDSTPFDAVRMVFNLTTNGDGVMGPAFGYHATFVTDSRPQRRPSRP
jgi:hypothetical protein